MRLMSVVLGSVLLAGPALAQDETFGRPPESRKYVAVVIGLSTYQNLPDEVELDFARSDAALVATALRETAKFDQVYQLTDREATREAIREIVRTNVAQIVGPDDFLLIYFTGHGIGADLGIPTLLAYDSTLENGQEDGLVVDGMARDVRTWNKAGNTMIVTDAIHQNQLDGIYFYGPAANEWPEMPLGTMIMSSSSAQQPAVDGTFGKVFAAAISGAADSNDDTYVTAAELHTFVLAAMGGSPQKPVSAGTYNGSMVVSEGVDRASVQTAGITPNNEIYPDVAIDKAKFVFREGAGQTVRCLDRPVVQCDPSCYVWEFSAGPCEVTAVIDGFSMKGRAVILSRGKYECKRQGPDLACNGPG